MSDKAHGIMFHHFHDNGSHIKSQGSIDQDQFRRMIVLLKEKHNLLLANEWYTKAIENSLGDNDICITFDDNLKCQYDIALPVLEEFNLTAFWFVYTSPLEGNVERLEIYRYFRFSEFETVNDFYEAFNSILKASEHNDVVTEKLEKYDSVEFLKHFTFYTEEDKLFRYIRDHILGVDRYYDVMDKMIEASKMDVEKLKHELWIDQEGISYLDKTGHMIGLHSHSHPTSMNSLNFEGQMAEYKKCHTILSGILNQEIKSMSHPCNSYNDDTLLLLEKLNVNFGFRANMAEGFTSSLEHPRLDHTYLIEKI